MRQHQVRVQFLNEKIERFTINPGDDGATLLQIVFDRLTLIEQDYFGLQYGNEDSLAWIDAGKPLKSQIKNLDSEVIRFAVKFWPLLPASQLIDEHTRYLFNLQIKSEIKHKRFTSLQPNDQILVKLLAFYVQADFGDFDNKECETTTYINEVIGTDKSFQDLVDLEKIRNEHKLHHGENPAECDLQILRIVSKLECYGITTYQTNFKGKELAVNWTGVHVVDNGKRVETFDWKNLRKVSFHKDAILLKLRHPDANQQVVKYKFKTRNHAKAFWKLCVETHAFFFLEVNHDKRGGSDRASRGKHGILSKGSTFSFVGNTIKEVQHGAQNTPGRPFERTRTLRNSQINGQMVNGGASVTSFDKKNEEKAKLVNKISKETREIHSGSDGMEVDGDKSSPVRQTNIDEQIMDSPESPYNDGDYDIPKPVDHEENVIEEEEDQAEPIYDIPQNVPISPITVAGQKNNAEITTSTEMFQNNEKIPPEGLFSRKKASFQCWKLFILPNAQFHFLNSPPNISVFPLPTANPR